LLGMTGLGSSLGALWRENNLNLQLKGDNRRQNFAQAAKAFSIE
jgi:hypothetical protein